jgi:hypothetical protein
MSQISSSLPQIYLDDTRVCDFTSSSQDTNCFNYSGCTAGKDSTAGCLPNTTCTACPQKPWSIAFFGTGVDVYGNGVFDCSDSSSQSDCQPHWSLDGQAVDCFKSGTIVLCSKRGLSNGNHTLTLNNGKSTLIDYALVQTQSDTPLHPKDKLFVDANVHSIRYTGEWQLLPDMVEFGYNVQRSTKQGDTISFDFLGNEVEAIATYNTVSDGGALVHMEITGSQGGSSPSADIKVENGLPRYFTSSSGDLTDGLYTAKVVLKSDGIGYNFNGFLFNPLSNATTVREAIDTPSVPSDTTTNAQPSPTGDSDRSSNSSRSSPAGAIAGGVVGGIVFLLVLFGVLFFCRRRRKNTEHEHLMPTPWEEPTTKEDLEAVRPPSLAYTGAGTHLTNRKFSLWNKEVVLYLNFVSPIPRSDCSINGHLTPEITPLMGTFSGFRWCY